MPAASKTPEYEKLTRGVRRYDSPLIAPRYRLWLAKDHLLHIRDTGYTESYKRFYFQDIQAIVVSATQTGKLRNVLFGVLTVLSGMLAFSGYRWWAWDGGGVVFVAGVAAFFFLMLVINILRGPTCQCVLYTGVHAEPIRALDRLRKARRTLQRLQPLIEAVQGGLSDEQLAEKRAALSGATATRRVTPPSKLESHGPLRHDEGRWHALLFVMVLVGAVLCALDPTLDPSVRHGFKNAFDSAWYLAILLLAVTVVVKQSGTDLKARLGGMAWAIMLAVAASFMTVTVYGMTLSMSDPTLALNQTNMDSVARSHPFFLVYSVTMCAIYALLGIIGFLLLSDFRRVYRRTQEAAQPAPEPNAVEET